MRDRIICGDALTVLCGMPEEGVHCCVTSPPYWSLRDYGANGQLGLEPTLEEYVAKMVEVFCEVRRVLRSDGTLWLNMGDSYGNNQGKGFDTHKDGGERKAASTSPAIKHPTKVKDLIGQPWRLASALQADGWWLRSDIIWAKKNPMPESVQGSHYFRHRVTVGSSLLVDCPGCPKCDKNDGYILRLSAGRPTKSHEYLFLLSKSPSYFYDAEAIREPAEYGRREWSDTEAVLAAATYGNDARANHGVRVKASVTGGDPSAGRNKRTVWTIATQPFPEAHFATFPEKLVEPCIRAGTSQRGCCAECGAPWVRVVEKGELKGSNRGGNYQGRDVDDAVKINPGIPGLYYENQTVDWRPSCECDAGDPVSAIVLDPFMGSGTVALVAKKLNRDFLGIELSPEYVEMAQRRLRAEMPLFIEEMA